MSEKTLTLSGNFDTDSKAYQRVIYLGTEPLALTIVERGTVNSATLLC